MLQRFANNCAAAAAMVAAGQIDTMYCTKQARMLCAACVWEREWQRPALEGQLHGVQTVSTSHGITSHGNGARTSACGCSKTPPYRPDVPNKVEVNEDAFASVRNPLLHKRCCLVWLRSALSSKLRRLIRQACLKNAPLAWHSTSKHLYLYA